METKRLFRLYSLMVRIRVFEERVADLVEAGQVKTPCHLYIGQEAIAAGICAALNQDDYIWGAHRSHGHYLAKGGDMRKMMAEIFGKKTGCAGGRGGSMHLIAKEHGLLGTVPLVGATVPLAVGAALASKMRKDGRVSVSFFGDGAVEEGHVHESINMAAIYKLPVIFVCENNFYSSHMHLSERRAKDNLDEVGSLYGIPSLRIDGNDVMQTYRASSEATERARRGDGPTFLECRTFRWRGHVGPAWDMDVGVKRKDELKDWLPKDPIARLEKTLMEQGASAAEFKKIKDAAIAEVEDAVDFSRQSPDPNVEELERFVFAENS